MQDISDKRNIKVAKVVLVGAAGVGKTVFMNRWIRGIETTDTYSPSVGADFALRLNGDGTLKFQCWDAAGQERYRNLLTMYLRSVEIVILMFDVTDEASFDALSGFISQAKKEAVNAPRFILVANKIDQAEQRIITDQKAEAFAQEQGIENYVAVSEKTGEGMEFFQEKMDRLALSLPAEPKPITATLSSSLSAEIEILEQLYTDNPRRGGRVAVQDIANILKGSVGVDNVQKYFDANLPLLKQHFNTLQLTWRSVVNTVLNVVLTALISLTVVGLPLLYCFNLWKPNKDSLQHSFRFLTFGEKQKAEKLSHDVMVEQSVQLSF